MSEVEDLKEQIAVWVKNSLEKENLHTIDVEITGRSEKGENYIGDILFVTATVRGGKEKHLVIKMGKKSKYMREKFNIREIYLREVKVYEKILPAFVTFQNDRNITEPFKCFAKCYANFVSETTEVLVMENIKDKGFEMYDRQKPFNQHHIEAVLKQYAKFHAISFAMKDQNITEYEALINDYSCMHEFVYLQPIMIEWYQHRLSALRSVVKEEDPDLAVKLEKLFEPGCYQMMEEILRTKFDEEVIIHGDCWNCNFMFLYEDDNKDIPKEIVILDWQVSCIHSPTIDLSYFLYFVADENYLLKIEQFLRFYHENFSSFMRELGSDPEKIFPYSTLIKHWNKCSSFGVLFAINVLEMMMCSKENALSVDDFDVEDMNDLEKMANLVKPKDAETYRKRILGIVRSYLETKQL